MPKLTVATLFARLREIALAYPDTFEEFPWGETAVKVRPTGKVFVFLRQAKDEVSISIKLPASRDMAADLPWAEPAHYGMGKYGWVTAHLKPADAPLDLLKAWIDESFRAVAPKKVVRQLDAQR